MADTGHAGTHAPQSMHSSGWMKSIGDCSNSGSSFLGWMQSTGQTSTHAVSLVPMHGSAMMYMPIVVLLPVTRLDSCGGVYRIRGDAFERRANAFSLTPFRPRGEDADRFLSEKR